MNRKDNEITSNQVFQFIVAGQVGFGILSMAASLAEDVGHDGWIAITIGGSFAGLLIWMIISTLKRFGNNSIIEINQLIFGKFMGRILNLIAIAYVVYTSILMMRMFNDIVRMAVLRTTPPLVISAFLLLPIIYLSWYGLKYICRFATVQMICIISVVLFYLLLMKYFRLSFLLPVAAAGPAEIIKVSFTPFTSFIGYELLTYIYPYIKDKNNTLKRSLYANSFTVVFYIITVAFITGFFGEVMLKQLVYPVFSLARAYRAPVIERLDLFFISLWFPIMLTTLLVYFYTAYNSLKKFLNIENDLKKCRILILSFAIMVLLLSRLPKDMAQLSTLFEQLGYISTGYVGYIFICFLLSFIKRGKKNNESST